MMKLAYLTSYDSSDIHTWSGLGNRMFLALQDAGFQTEAIGNLKQTPNLLWKAKRVLYPLLMRKKYHWTREPALLRSYAEQLGKALARTDCDVVFSPGTLAVAHLQTEKPIVFWTDATFAGMVGFYPQYSNLCPETVRKGNEADQLALEKCRLAIFSSRWAANTAIENYKVDPAKVKVVTFGANITCNRTPADIEQIASNKNFETCNLLFIGVDWARKGGDIALAVAARLNQRGIKTELHIVGCNPGIELPHYAKQYGFVSKKTESGLLLLDQLMKKAHFFILPTRAENSALVLAEANSYGLPSLTTNVGGLGDIIHNQKNGQMFSPDDDPEEYCGFIMRYMSSRQEYIEFALSSFAEYSERLNWSVAGRKAHDLIMEFCA